MGRSSSSQLRPVRPWRRLIQWGVFLALAMIPLASRNPVSWPPSRIAQGHLPPPRVFPVNGDTWSLTVGSFTFTHPLAFLETVLSAKVVVLSLLVSALLPLALTLVMGRVFCSWLCPVGFCLEALQKAGRKLGTPASRRRWRFTDRRLVILGVVMALSLFLAVPILSHFDPPHLLGRELMYLATLGSVSMSGVGLLAGMLLLDLLVFSRAWCNGLCPSGGGLALLGSRRLLRIRMDRERCTRCGECNSVCPYYLEPMRLAAGESFDWQKCDNCGLCRDICPEGAIRFTMQRSS